MNIDAAKSSVSGWDGCLLGEKKKQCGITSGLDSDSTVGACFAV